VLWVVLKFGLVECAVRRSQQMGLCSSPEPAQVLDGGDADSHRHLLRLTRGRLTKGEGEGGGAYALAAAWYCRFECDYDLLQGLEIVYLVKRTDFQGTKNGPESRQPGFAPCSFRPA
jgi:hypothetical protein